jgi:hypothetical protein
MRGGPGRGRGRSWSAAPHPAASVPYLRSCRPPGWNVGAPGDRGTRIRLGAMGSCAARGAVRSRTAGYGRDGDRAARPPGSDMRTGGNQIPGTMPVTAPAWCPADRRPPLPGGPRSPSGPACTCSIMPGPGPAATPLSVAFAQHDLGQGWEACRPSPEMSSASRTSARDALRCSRKGVRPDRSGSRQPRR